MHDSPLIPRDYALLVGLLRCAVNGKPPDDDLTAIDWPAVLRQARKHSVVVFLYPWLALHAPALFSSQATAPKDSAPVAWRSLYLESVARAVQRQRQLAVILGALESAGIDVLPLKGAWLSAFVYDDPAQRAMTDLDLLVRTGDRDASHTQFLALGYSVKQDLRQSPFVYCQTYVSRGHPYPIELHWEFDAELIPNTPIPDSDAVWENSARTAFLGRTAHRMSGEDQLVHLVHHILHHQFALPLRAYLDLALLIRKQEDGISRSALDKAVKRWKVGRAAPFVLGLVSELFGVPPPHAVASLDAPRATPLFASALQALFTLPEARDCIAETTLLQLRQATAPQRLKLVLSRVFMPRSFLVQDYPCARHLYGLPIAWCLRAVTLVRRNRTRMWDMRDPASTTSKALDNSAARVALVQTLLHPEPNENVGAGQHR